MANEKKSPTTHRVYGGDVGSRGNAEVYGFVLQGTTEAEREQIMATVAQLVAEHASANKIIYTRQTGRTPDGRLFAEATLLPVGESIRVTLGADPGMMEDKRELRRLATYMLSAYLTLVYEISIDDTEQLCRLADEEAEAEGEP